MRSCITAVRPLYPNSPSNQNTEKLTELRRLNIISGFHLCALFSESSVLSLFLKALRAQRKSSVFSLRSPCLKAPTSGTFGCGSPYQVVDSGISTCLWMLLFLSPCVISRLLRLFRLVRNRFLRTLKNDSGQAGMTDHFMVILL